MSFPPDDNPYRPDNDRGTLSGSSYDNTRTSHSRPLQPVGSAQWAPTPGPPLDNTVSPPYNNPYQPDNDPSAPSYGSSYNNIRTSPHSQSFQPVGSAPWVPTTPLDNFVPRLNISDEPQRVLASRNVIFLERASPGRGQGLICRFPNCRDPMKWGMTTEEFSEYCGEGHMQDDLRRGVPVCPACNRIPRRLNSNYCGSSCEMWAALQQRQGQGQPPQQQGVLQVWDDMFLFQPPPGYQHPPAGGLLRCQRCGTTYRAGGRGGSRYEIPTAGHSSSPSICPSCDEAA